MISGRVKNSASVPITAWMRRATPVGLSRLTGLVPSRRS